MGQVVPGMNRGRVTSVGTQTVLIRPHPRADAT